MAKREINWQPDIYDMAARQAADPSPPLPQPSGRISNLTERRKAAPVPLVISDPLDEDDEDTSLLLDGEDDPLLDDEDAFAAADDSDYPLLTPRNGKAANAAPSRRPAPAGDNSGLLGLLLGALVGAGLTLLVTPAGGKQLRTRLQAEVQQQAARGNADTEPVAHNMPNKAVSEQAAPIAGAARP